MMNIIKGQVPFAVRQLCQYKGGGGDGKFTVAYKMHFEMKFFGSIKLEMNGYVFSVLSVLVILIHQFH